jgi:peptidoglycan/LPS O-acetylase OafA/YrhL
MFWGWSLALEEQFYLTVPLLFFVLQRLRSDRVRLALLVSLWASCLVARVFIYLRHTPWTDLALYEALYFRPLTRFDTLVCGILLAFVHQRYKAQLTTWLGDPFHRALLALPPLACLWLLLRPWMFGKEYVQIVHLFAWGSVTSVMYFGWLVLLLHGEPGWISRALSRPFFRRWATLGYGVYLVHIPLCDHAIVPLARALQGRFPMAILWPCSIVLLMALSLGLAYVLHVLVEKPSLRVRERIAG